MIILFIILSILVFVLFYFAVRNGGFSNSEIQKAKEAIKIHQKREDSLQRVYVKLDSILQEKEQKILESETKIKINEKVLQQIPAKYIRVRDSLIRLNTDAQFSIFSRWLSQIDSTAHY